MNPAANETSVLESPLNIAFGMMGGDTWPAGEIYFVDLLRALRKAYRPDVGLYVLASEGPPVRSEVARQVDRVLTAPKVSRYTPLWAIDRGTKLFLSRDVVGEIALKRQGVDVVAFVNPFHALGLPSLSWIPDFQHVHMPEMFSDEERHARDQGFMRIARQSTRVVLLSNSAKEDFEAFAPSHAQKARVVRPVSYVAPGVYQVDPQSTSQLYNLPERFVYLPGQFWKHKNHETVFRALKMLKQDGINVFLACSGYPGDYRHPTHFADLIQKLSRWDLRNQVAFLGVLPRDHVFSLMRQSICVLNPSLFEGFGLTVEEARSVGKRLLVSDIAPHREQDPPRAVFFDPRDPHDVAQKLREAWESAPQGPDSELEANARQALPQRLRAYAEAFMSVVQEAAGRTIALTSCTSRHHCEVRTPS
jgi:glycosyltransferase involved in cell wall biosynthesis